MLKAYNIKLSFLLVFASGLLLNSCSWVEQFIIKNNTTETIEITYELNPQERGFALFHTMPEVYEMNSRKGIDWDKKREMQDTDTSYHKVNVKLPPNHVLIIGSLHNQTYERYDQDFYNDRHFNLKHLTVKTADELIDVTPQNFDKQFYKAKGEIVLLVE